MENEVFEVKQENWAKNRQFWSFLHNFFHNITIAFFRFSPPKNFRFSPPKNVLPYIYACHVYGR